MMRYFNDRERCAAPNVLEELFRDYCILKPISFDCYGLDLVDWEDNTNGSGRKDEAEYTQEDHELARLSKADFVLKYMLQHMRDCHNFPKTYKYDIWQEWFISLKTAGGHGYPYISYMRIIKHLERKGINRDELMIIDVSNIKDQINNGDDHIEIYLDRNINVFYVYIGDSLRKAILPEEYMDWEGDFVTYKEKIFIYKEKADFICSSKKEVISNIENLTVVKLNDKIEQFKSIFSGRDYRVMVPPSYTEKDDKGNVIKHGKTGNIQPFILNDKGEKVPAGDKPHKCYLNTPPQTAPNVSPPAPTSKGNVPPLPNFAEV